MSARGGGVGGGASKVKVKRSGKDSRATAGLICKASSISGLQNKHEASQDGGRSLWEIETWAWSAHITLRLQIFRLSCGR